MPSEVVLCDDHVHDCPYLLKQVGRLAARIDAALAKVDYTWISTCPGCQSGHYVIKAMVAALTGEGVDDAE